MQVDFALKAGDTLPVLETMLVDSTGAPIDLTAATSVSFNMALEGADTLTVNQDASVIGLPTAGTVQYAWQEDDTAVPGNYLAAFLVTYPAGVQTFPSDDFINILVQPNLTSVPVNATPVFVGLDDVTRVTGRTDVNQSSLVIAWSVIEGIIGRPLYELLVSLIDNQNVLTVRDTYWLTAATAWQAAWVTDNPDIFSSLDVSRINQSGQSAGLLADGLIISPMARRCLRWVTWQKVRSVKIQRPFPYGRLPNPTVTDDLGRPWGRV